MMVMMIPMVVILVGIVTDVSFAHDWKAAEPNKSEGRVRVNKC